MTKSARQTFAFFEPGEAPAGIDEAALDRARTAIEKLKRAYVTEWAPASLDELDRALKMALSNPHAAREQFDLAYRIAHDMKGQGATFGFGLISEIGAALCALTKNRVQATAAEVQAMLAHVAAANAILTDELDDPAAPEAIAVMASLKTAVRANLH